MLLLYFNAAAQNVIHQVALRLTVFVIFSATTSCCSKLHIKGV